MAGPCQTHTTSGLTLAGSSGKARKRRLYTSSMLLNAMHVFVLITLNRYVQIWVRLPV